MCGIHRIEPEVTAGLRGNLSLRVVKGYGGHLIEHDVDVTTWVGARNEIVRINRRRDGMGGSAHAQRNTSADGRSLPKFLRQTISSCSARKRKPFITAAR